MKYRREELESFLQSEVVVAKLPDRSRIVVKGGGILVRYFRVIPDIQVEHMTPALAGKRQAARRNRYG